MSVQHIKEITINNFKCFKKFELNQISRVNLIGGQNNVGKTALLEAIELLENSNKSFDLLSQIHKMLKRRQADSKQEFVEIDFMSDDSQSVIIKSKTKKCEIKVTDEENTECEADEFNEFMQEDPSNYYLTFSVNSDKKNVSAERLMSTKSFLKFTGQAKARRSRSHFIHSSKMNEKNISILYGSLIDLNKESFLNTSLSSFDSNLLSLKQKASSNRIILKVQLKDKKYPVLLSSLGDGINRYIAIICAIWASENGILLIDEIENGIHYSNYSKLWELIFSVSKEANCQIFVTSHSKECIEAFNKVQIEKTEGLYLELYRNLKTLLVTASSRNAEQLQYALTHKGDVRGE